MMSQDSKRLNEVKQTHSLAAAAAAARERADNAANVEDANRRNRGTLDELLGCTEAEQRLDQAKRAEARCDPNFAALSAHEQMSRALATALRALGVSPTDA